jgi:hypothetical protein
MPEETLLPTPPLFLSSSGAKSGVWGGWHNIEIIRFAKKTGENAK